MFDIPGRALDHCAGVHLVLVIGEGVDVGLGHPHPYTCFPFMLVVVIFFMSVTKLLSSLSNLSL